MMPSNGAVTLRYCSICFATLSEDSAATTAALPSSVHERLRRFDLLLGLDQLPARRWRLALRMPPSIGRNTLWSAASLATAWARCDWAARSFESASATCAATSGAVSFTRSCPFFTALPRSTSTASTNPATRAWSVTA